MTKDDCYLLGNISRTHANQGELCFWLDVDNPADYLDLESVLIDIDNALVPYFIRKMSLGNKQIAYVSIDDINTIDDARRLVGRDLWLPLTRLPKLEGNKFYFHEIVGFELIDSATGRVGIITNVYDLSGNPLIAADHDGAEVLVPLNDAFIDRLARDERRLYMSLPPGLIDVYLNA